jgi:hypothetical protein
LKRRRTSVDSWLDSEVCVESSEHFTHIISRSGCDCRSRAAIGQASYRTAAGVHQLGEHAPGLVIGKHADRILSPRISDFAGDFVFGHAAPESPYPDELLTFSIRARAGAGERRQGKR